MNCPVCAVELRVSERQGVEIDYCPQCRGVWLDRGELDKILERSAGPWGQEPGRSESSGAFGGRPERGTGRDEDRGTRRDDDDWERRGEGEFRKRKRRSFLNDLFDFD